jgi:FlaA1/EpsC-like NDP-sugar epimerase
VAVEDLLLRPSVKIDYRRLEKFIAGKSIIVTGGGGSIGAEICDRVVAFGAKRLLIIENSEPALYTVQETLATKSAKTEIEGRLADVRDRERIFALFKAFKPDLVFHAAALKHVPLLEADWAEAVKTNVFGSVHVADAAVAAGAAGMVLISTDKAVEPVSVLGATKRFAEMYCQALDAELAQRAAAPAAAETFAVEGEPVPRGMARVSRARRASGQAHELASLEVEKEEPAAHELASVEVEKEEPAAHELASLAVEQEPPAASAPARLVAVRFGNVLGSNGSVVPKFKAQIAAGGPVTVTHPQMVRYFMTIREACDLVLCAAGHALAPPRSPVSVYVLNMGQPVNILALAERMIRLSGLEPGRDIDIVFTGLRPGERLHELLLARDEDTTDIGIAGVVGARPPHPPLAALRGSLATLGQALARAERAELYRALRAAVADFRGEAA